MEEKGADSPPPPGYEAGRPDIDPATERKLVRKLDLHIVPLVMLLYLLSFLDRVNIGNAKLYRLEQDLHLSTNQYSTAVSLLFVTYITSELPSNLIIKNYVRPSRWIAFITTAWGVIATLTGVCQSYAGLIVCRLALGLVEGGLFPGATIYLTLFYTKREIALRIGYLFVSAALAGAFGGLLAYGIGHMQGVAGLDGWRWIMIMEGLPTFLLGISCWFIMADSPETAPYLTPTEKSLLISRRSAQIGQSDVFDWADVRAGLRDWKIYIMCLGQFGADNVLYGFSTFLPTIIEGIRPDASAAVVQLLTVPIYAVGAVSYMAAARFSDWTQLRGPVVVLVSLVAVVGYAVLLSPVGASGHYAGCFLVAIGLYVAVGIPLAWLPSNNPRYGKRTTATGLQLTIGNTAGILASFLYPSTEAPRFVRGQAVSMSLLIVSCAIYTGMHFYFRRENAKRARGERDGRIAGLTDEEVVALGDENPRFVFAT